jgi:hypothetical protein
MEMDGLLCMEMDDYEEVIWRSLSGLGNCEEVGNSRTLLSRDSPGKVVV